MADQDSTSTSESASSAIAEEILATATANAADGIQSYTHGSRTVTRSSPRAQLEFLQDLELRERRKRYGICLYCDQGGR